MDNMDRIRFFFVAMATCFLHGALVHGKEPSNLHQQNVHGQLVDDLLASYFHKAHVRPVLNTSTVTTVAVRQKINELIEMDVRNQRIQIKSLLKQTWRDEFLNWNSSEYGGITKIQLPSELIWIPDITLHGNIDGEFERIKSTEVVVDSEGTVTWFAPAIFTSSCRMNVRYFPFDIQTCKLLFSSWVYNGFELDLVHESGGDSVQDSFLENGVWDLQDVHVDRDIRMYTCCPEPYPELVFTLILRRRSSYYISYIILPCVFLSALSLLVFYLPSECGEKLTLSITNLLALVVFQQLIAESMPPSGDNPPVIGDYFLTMILMVCLSVVTTVLVLHVSAKKSRLPQWMQLLFLRFLSRILCMHREEFDHNPQLENKVHASSTVDYALKLLPVENSTKGQCIAGNEPVKQNCDDIPVSVGDDLHFIRRDLENRNMEEMAVEQWKHVGRVLDKCLLIIFFVLFVITSAILISRARGPA